MLSFSFARPVHTFFLESSVCFLTSWDDEKRGAGEVCKVDFDQAGVTHLLQDSDENFVFIGMFVVSRSLNTL